jgi:hypothetical protein
MRKSQHICWPRRMAEGSEYNSEEKGFLREKGYGPLTAASEDAAGAWGVTCDNLKNFLKITRTCLHKAAQPRPRFEHRFFKLHCNYL